jgi:signal transduction histidine kinase
VTAPGVGASPLWLPGIALALAAVLFGAEEPDRVRLTHAALGAVAVLLTWMAAITVHVRYPRRRLAVLLFVLSALLACIPALAASSNPYLFTMTRIARPAAEVLLVWVMLVFPSGRAPERIDRLLFGVVAGAVTFLYLPAMAFTIDGPIRGPYMVCGDDCPRNVLFVGARPELADKLLLAFRVAIVVGLAAVALRLGARLLEATPRMRVVLAPVYAAFAVHLGSLGLYLATDAIAWLPVVVYWGIPIAIAVGIVRGRLATARLLEQLVSDLRESPSQRDLHALVARALEDPWVRVGYWLPAASRWVDFSGDEFALPRPDDRRRAARIIVGEEGERIAVLVHDTALLDEPSLLDAVASSVRLSVTVHQLDAALRDSRRTAATAAAAERERLERDLHDSAQQRLIALRMKLSMVGRLHPGDTVRARALVEEASADVDTVLRELRDLAHGHVPSVLVEGGLAPALRELARRCDRNVRTQIAPVGRLDAAIEQAVYFCCAEALQNAAKHAGSASTVWLSLEVVPGELRFGVEDDGPGRIGSRRGTGIDNMHRRVEEVGGRLVIGERPSGGARVTGTVPIPC